MSTRKYPPGPKSIIPLANLIPFRRDPLAYFQKLTRRYGDIVSFKIGMQEIILVNSPEYIKDILVTNSSKFVKGRVLERAKIILGEGLLTSNGEVHKKQRRMIQPMFNHSKIEAYGQIMSEISLKYVNKWIDKQELDINEEIVSLTLDIVCKTLFETQVKDDIEKIHQSMTTVLEMFNEVTNPLSYLIITSKKKRAFNAALNTLNVIIENIINERKNSGILGNDLLSALIHAKDEEDSQNIMTDTQIRDEVMTFFMAGHETTATLLTWTFYLLSQYPEVENKLIKELQEVIENNIPSARDVANLVYTKKVLTEVMRLYPPAWTLGRKNLEEYELSGYKIKPNTIFITSQYVTHHDERFFPEPNKFDPDRWSDEFKSKLPKFAYFPFGGGQRLCIGEPFVWMEGALVLATIYQKWSLKHVKGHEVKLYPLVTLKPKFGMKMILHKRV